MPLILGGGGALISLYFSFANISYLEIIGLEALETPYCPLDIAILITFATNFIQVILVQCMGSSGVTLVLNTLTCTLTTAVRGWISWHRSYTPSRQTPTIGGSSCLPGTQLVRGHQLYLYERFIQALSVTKTFGVFIFTVMTQSLHIIEIIANFHQY